MPYIAEIRFVVPPDPVSDFRDGRLHMLLDLGPQQAAALAKDETGLRDHIAVRTMRNRRIYFLAVNHRNRALQNQDLRKALAHAIDRTKILDEVYRVGATDSKEPPHRALNGPYPPGSWACKPSGLPADPYMPQMAAEKAKAASAALSMIRLSLKYPDGDAAVKEACEKIQAQVEAATGVKLELVPRSRRDLHKDVEIQHDYELAYYAYDFPSEAYWLWPLFNPDARAINEPGGSNFLGYQNDGRLEALFQTAMSHRDFARVREVTHQIHQALWERMPFIPLWQLDTVIAIHRDVITTRIDPLVIFSEIERWKLGTSKES
jgi:ABC-type oligopeptide transport system substrate-binding subunit